MVHKSSLQSRIILLPIVAIGLFLSTILIAVAAQEAPPSLTVTPSTSQVASGDLVTFTMLYDFPEAYDFTWPIEIVATWSNATFVEVADAGAPELDAGGTQATWTYEPGSLNPAALPTFTLTAGDALEPIDVTVTIFSPAQPDVALRTIEGTANVQILNATSTESAEEPQQIDLSTSTLELDPTDPVMAGSPISFTVTVRNTGSTAAEGVIVTLESDPRLQHMYLKPPLSAVLDTLATTGGSSYRVLDAVGSGAEVPIRFSGIVAPDTSGDLQVKGLITTPEGLEVPVENTVQVEPALPLLAVDIEGPDSAMIGEALSFLLRVSNTGRVSAENAKVVITTSPAVTLEVVDGGEVKSTQAGANRLVLEFADIASGDMAEVTLTGIAPSGSAPLLVDVATQDEGLYDSQSVLTKSLPISLTPPPPTATPEPVITEPPPTAEPGPSFTPTPAKTEVVPPAEPPDSSTTSLLVIGIVALLAAIVAGVVLFLLLRGRRKPTPPPPATVEDPGQPGPVPPPPPLPAGAVLESLTIPGRRLRVGDGTTTIGRAPDSAICINERYMHWETVSRRHAEIRREGGDYVIYDVSKRNGIYVEGRRTARNLLRSGWRVGIGGVEFIFHDVARTNQ